MAILVLIWLVSQDGTATNFAALSAATIVHALHAAEQAPETVLKGAKPVSEKPHSSKAIGAPSENSLPEKSNVAAERRAMTAPTTPSRDLSKTDEANSRSILQMLEGRETEVNIGLIVAAIAFAMGWLCGVSYYSRRERKARHKLRF